MRSHGAFVFGVDLAAAVPLSAARPVDERFCALRHGTDAAGLAEHTVAAHPAGLAEDARTLDLSEKQRVIRGEDRDHGIGRDSLCAVAAGQTDDGLRAAVAQGLEIALDEQHMAALVRQDVPTVSIPCSCSSWRICSSSFSPPV